MQIVIDIPESILNTIQADEMISREQLAVLQVHILSGTPLPKGHGRLIDADEVIKIANKTKDLHGAIWNTPTIIEAEKQKMIEILDGIT